MEKQYSYNGKSVIFDVILKNSVNIEFLIEHMKLAILTANMHIVDFMHKKFEPQGDTVVFILSESAMQLHTYPESRYYSFDIYTCGEANPEVAIEYLKSVLDIEKFTQKLILRGQI